MSKTHSEMIDEQIAQDLIDYPLKSGYQRMYEDHTYRGFYDMSPEEIQASIDDPIMKILREEIQKELNKEILSIINK